MAKQGMDGEKVPVALMNRFQYMVGSHPFRAAANVHLAELSPLSLDVSSHFAVYYIIKA